MNCYMKKIIFAIGVVISLFSCSKTLDLVPLDSASVDGFFKTQQDFDLALNGLYDYMQSKGQGGLGGVYGGGHYWDVMSDGFYFQFSWHTPYYEFSSGNISPTTPNVQYLWDISYRAIGWANRILTMLETSDLLDAYKSQVEGQTRFLRAITYLRLVSTYGDVPLVVKNLDLNEVRVPRTTKDSVFVQIISDLDIAASRLQVDPYNSQRGRITKQAAMGLKVRALTYWASPLFNEANDAARWTAAKNAATELMQLAAANSDKIGLMPTYNGVFTAANEDNKEVLFNVEYISNGSQEGNNDLLPFGPRRLPTQSGVASGWGSSAIVPEYAESYLMSDGMKASQSPLYSADQPFANRDPRFYTTFFVAKITVLSNGGIFDSTYLNSFAGPAFQKAYPLSVRKFIDENAKNQIHDNEQAPNHILLRYADILLMFAEAENEISGPTQDAYDAINQVRARAGLPDITPGLSKDDFRATVQNERKWELGFEGLRYFDIRRWKIADVVLNNLPKGTTFNIAPPKKFYPEKNYWWPIAQATIDASPNLTQNPNY